MANFFKIVCGLFHFRTGTAHLLRKRAPEEGFPLEPKYLE